MRKILFTFLASFLFVSFSQASTGYIDTAYTNHAKVCYDTTCTTPTPSIINFELSQQPSITIDSVTGISGYVWGDALGWINMNPTGAGVTFANPTTGLLTGKAWSQVSGWINFAVTNQEVTINSSTGEFAGWAWTGGPYGGWIKFDCSDSSSCVKTTWHPASNGGGGGGGGGHPDVCPNIEGIQPTIPNGYTVDNFGKCVQIVDICPNLLGDQTTMPTGYQYNEIGACIPTTIDYCPNIKGNQNVVPKGYIIDEFGDCIKTPVDLCPSDLGVQTSYSECTKEQIKKDICPNLPGIQEILPDNQILSGGLCYPKTFDICPNISEAQQIIPIGYVISADGTCMPKPDDLCENLGGSQVIVPQGFIKKENNCFLISSQERDEGINSSGDIRVVALPFIPSSIWVVSDNNFAKASVKVVDRFFHTTLSSEPYHVDLISFNIVALIVLILFALLLLFIKRALFKPLQS